MKSKPVYIPSFFTILNLLGGFLSIVLTLEGNFQGAAWLIILAILCDGMDGKLARWMHSETPFGFELDSLADMVSSGLAPAVLAYRAVFHDVQALGLILCFSYVFAGSYRLARFNVVQAGDRSRGYTGLPIPVAGFTIASFWIFNPPFDLHVALGWWIFLLLSLTVLMVSTVHYFWPRLTFREGWKSWIRSTGMLLALGMMAVFPQWSLFPLFILYIALGFWQWTKYAVKGEYSLSEFFLQVKKELK